MNKPKTTKRTSMTIEDAEILLDAYDSFGGLYHPKDREEHRALFNGLRNRIKKAKEEKT